MIVGIPKSLRAAAIESHLEQTCQIEEFKFDHFEEESIATLNKKRVLLLPFTRPEQEKSLMENLERVLPFVKIGLPTILLMYHFSSARVFHFSKGNLEMNFENFGGSSSENSVSLEGERFEKIHFSGSANGSFTFSNIFGKRGSKICFATVQIGKGNLMFFLIGYSKSMLQLLTKSIEYMAAKKAIIPREKVDFDSLLQFCYFCFKGNLSEAQRLYSSFPESIQRKIKMNESTAIDPQLSMAVNRAIYMLGGYAAFRRLRKGWLELIREGID